MDVDPLVIGPSPWGMALLTTVPMNLLDLLVIGAVLALIVLLFLHRLLWPLVHLPIRILYEWFPSRPILFSLGVTFLGLWQPAWARAVRDVVMSVLK
jgi:hypothetical protein